MPERRPSRPWPSTIIGTRTLSALRSGGAAAGGGQIVFVAPDDVGDHVAHLRVSQAAGLLEGGELILETRLELTGDPALLLDQFPAGAFALLDLPGDALETRGQFFVV